MIAADQAKVVDFLVSSFTHGGAAVERIETHASIVFLAGDRAWKLKRAVRYDYLDFSTIDRRRAMCEAEVRINRRTAPDIYRGVIPVTREADGALALGGHGAPVDWLVEMARFDQELLFDRLAARGALDLALMPLLAEEIARFHGAAERRPDHGGRPGMAWVVDGNATGFATEAAGILDAAACGVLIGATRSNLDQSTSLLEARRRAGYVRQCHGDLHLRNIVLRDGRPTLFDAIEFNDEIACVDVLYDLAFLVMDLWRRGLPRHANAILNGYLAKTRDVEGLPLLPLFLACRAAVRAKTSATSSSLQREDARREELQRQAREYLRMAGDLLNPRAVCLVAIGGLSGTGKSTLAVALAPMVGPVPGAVVLRSDALRKQLCGVSPSTRLGAEGYAPEVSQRVYATLAERAGSILRGPHAVIADAVFARSTDREAIESMTTAAGVPFVGLWLDAPAPVLTARVAQRGPDVSDADPAVVRTQLKHDVGSVHWHRIDASGDGEGVLRSATAVLDHVASRSLNNRPVT